jgi:hypothetical protein
MFKNEFEYNLMVCIHPMYIYIYIYIYMFNKENKPRRSSEEIHWRVGTERHYPEDGKDEKKRKLLEIK